MILPLFRWKKLILASFAYPGSSKMKVLGPEAKFDDKLLDIIRPMVTYGYTAGIKGARPVSLGVTSRYLLYFDPQKV